MIEYIFFDAALRDKFVAHAKQRGVPYTEQDDHMGMVVAIPEDIPEEISDEIEEYYETLEDEQEQLSKTEGDLKRLAGFGFKLPNGESRLLPVETEMANRLLANFTLEEIQSLFNAVADCTLNPNDEHLCHILATRSQKDQ
ncbi:conserved hypothetical protein [Sideroxydans lithotrophicus ES-1]|uniref:Uncharacterized protein n=2 Tax=Sideroxydans TaxID=314343 RepID=D5CLR5_SIDLE|nr:conserved hypothetical protein [Sideroxydans lithotrophicus ES-1]